jgi:hypothetical protein
LLRAEIASGALRLATVKILESRGLPWRRTDRCGMSGMFPMRRCVLHYRAVRVSERSALAVARSATDDHTVGYHE